jgi:hypothetical protein
MDATELIACWIDELQRQVRMRVGELTADELAWRADPGGNSVGVTVWHFSRWLDFMLVCAFEGRPQGEQQWFARGWATRTGYDPRGIGEQGYGTLTGYTLEEVDRVPQLTAEELLSYLGQTAGALRAYVLALEPAELRQAAGSSVTPEPDGAVRPRPTRTDEERARLDWLTGILTGCFRHSGEIEALNAIRRRTAVGTKSSPASRG